MNPRGELSPNVLAYWNRFLQRARASSAVEDDRGLLRPTGRRIRGPFRFYWDSWQAAKGAWEQRQAQK